MHNELPGVLIVHDTSVGTSLFNELMSKDWSPFQNLFLYSTGDEAIRTMNRWSDRVASIVIHKDLGDGVRGMSSLDFLTHLTDGDLARLPYHSVVSSGEATDKGVSDRVVRAMFADALWDITLSSLSGVVALLRDPGTRFAQERARGLQRGVNVLWEGRVSEPTYIWGAGRSTGSDRSQGWGYGD